MFLVKREESRSFDVFFGCLFVFERGEKHVEKPGKEQNSAKNDSPQCERCVWLFIAPTQISRQWPLKGHHL